MAYRGEVEAESYIAQRSHNTIAMLWAMYMEGGEGQYKKD